MPKLEVIVTSQAEAVVAAEGGADRLELVRALETGGLTPELEIVRTVSQRVAIPVRVMLRENASMAVAGKEELEILQNAAAHLQKCKIDGLVMGWIDEAGEVDVASLTAVLSKAPKCKVTFHRAFEHLGRPIEALTVLKRFGQIDRILTGGGVGSWEQRKTRLRQWRKAAGPEIGIIVGGGLAESEVVELMLDAEFPEVHVGRAARIPQENDGLLDAGRIQFLKSRRGE